MFILPLTVGEKNESLNKCLAIVKLVSSSSLHMSFWTDLPTTANLTTFLHNSYDFDSPDLEPPDIESPNFEDPTFWLHLT